MIQAVLDASTAVDLVIEAERSSVARAIVSGIERLAAPALIDFEYCSAMARQQRAGTLTKSEADGAIVAFMNLRLSRFDLRPLVPNAWALRGSVGMADAFYVALALSLGCPLVTSDTRLAKAGIKGLAITLIA